jgi:hypothetical protein
MYYQVTFEQRRKLIQDVIDRLTRLNSVQVHEYLNGLEALNNKFDTDMEATALGVRFYPVNSNLKTK